MAPTPQQIRVTSNVYGTLAMAPASTTIGTRRYLRYNTWAIGNAQAWTWGPSGGVIERKDDKKRSFKRKAMIID